MRLAGVLAATALVLFGSHGTHARELHHREVFKGFLIVEKNQLYFTELYNSGTPRFRVEWWNGKPPLKSICAINLIPTCKPVELSFEKKTVKHGKKTEIVLTHAIFEEELKADRARLLKKK